MKTIRSLFILLSVATLLTFAYSCEKSTPTPEPVTTVGAFVLNNGNWGSNDASLGRYDINSKTFESNVFSKVNGKKLGDLAQDICVTGNKMFIAVSGSKIIFVTDTTAKILKEIVATADGNTLSPRQFTIGGDKVYVTYYEGYLGEIDLDSYAVKTVQVGSNPEGVAYIGGKIYVANSGGLNYPDYDNTVSVVDAASFTVTKTLKVVTNPSYMEVSSGKVYLASVGNYADIPTTLQIIDPSSDAVTTVPDVVPTWMALGTNGMMYIISSVYDENWNATVKFYKYDTTTDKLLGEFISDGTTINGAYNISADPISGNVYIGSSDYTTNGDMYVFSPEGKLLDKFDTGGLNPIGVYFVTNK